MRAADGLSQKFDPLSLPMGKSAKAINLEKTKNGSLTKRLGFWQLGNTDPFGSGFQLTAGVSLGAWNDGVVDNLIAIGRGQRPGAGNGNAAGVLLAYSDDLGGLNNKGYGPELNVEIDADTGASQGTCFSPCEAASGDYVVQAWIDPAYNFQSFNAGTDPHVQPPIPAVGPIFWSASQVSTGQQIVGPTILDTSILYAQCVRLAVVGTTFIICYSAASSLANQTDRNGFIYARTLTAASLAGGGQFSPAPTSAPITVVNAGNAAVVNPYGTSPGPVVNFFNANGWAMPGGYFDMKAVGGDTTNFVLAYATGTFTLAPRGVGGTWTGTNIVVDQRPVVSPGTLSQQWAVEAIPGTVPSVGGFGVRAESSANFGLNQVAVAWAYWDTTANSYRVKSAAGIYSSMSQLNTSTVIYTAADDFETSPSWLSVRRCTQVNTPGTTYVVSHSPMGSCWNAAFTTAQAGDAIGTGATAHAANLNGSVVSVNITQQGFGNYTTLPGIAILPANGFGLGASVSNVDATSDGFNSGHFVGGITVGTGGSGYTTPPTAVAVGGASSSGITGIGALSTTVLYSLDVISPSQQIVVDNGGSGYSSNNLPQVTFGMGGAGSGAVIVPNTFTAQGGIASCTVSNGGSNYDPNNPPIITVVDTKANFTGASANSYPGSGANIVPVISAGGQIIGTVVINPGSGYSSNGDTKIFVSGGAVGAAVVDPVSGHVTGVNVTTAGHYYPSPPPVYIKSPQSTAPLTQPATHRLGGIGGFTGGGSSSQLWYPGNNARIIQNMVWVNLIGQPIQRYNNLCGSSLIGLNPCNTSGVTLASDGLEANGIVYYLGWVPSLTQGSFVVLAFDLACAPNITGTGFNGTVFPMRPVGVLQKQTALADPGYGFQPTPNAGSGYPFLATLLIQSPTAPNCWTGGSSWSATGDTYGTASVTYVSSAQGARLSPALGVLQTTPAQGFYCAKFGNLTAVSGALPGLYDGQNFFEQGFLYTPESIIATLYKDNSTLNSGSITWASATDSYSWIFCWEHWDAQGNFYRSPRAVVTITGQDILDAYGPGTIANSIQSLPFTGGVTFRIPTLGVTNRQWPTPVGAASQPSYFGSDLRAYAQPPTNTVTLGAYRTTKNQQTYYRVYDRYYNGNDLGGASFTLGNVIQNSFALGLSGQAYSQVCCVEFTDGLADTFLQDPQNFFPLLYGDGTNGNPGSLDAYGPPASPIICHHKERLFVAKDNVVYFTKQRSEAIGPEYNPELFTIFVGDDDPITGLASLDDKLIILKPSQVYYVAGDGPGDDGSGNNFTAPQPIPTDAGCSNPGSVISTPEGVYFQSDAGLRIVTRSLAVEYVGGPVEDELSTNPVVQAAVLYPTNNKVIFAANTQDTKGANLQLQGELLTRDYVLDCWTTSVINNGGTTTGAASLAVASGWGQPHVVGPTTVHAPALPRLHFIDTTGQIWREHDPNLDPNAYFDNNTYVSWTWLSPMLRPSESYQGRFRLWDIIALLRSHDPHGLLISVGIDYGTPGQTRTWVWNSATGAPSIAPGGVIPTPLTQIRTYDGRLGEAFQVQVQDVSDPHSTNGEGSDFIGLTLSVGTPQGPYKLPASATQ